MILTGVLTPDDVKLLVKGILGLVSRLDIFWIKPLGYRVYYQEVDLIQECIEISNEFSNCSSSMSNLTLTHAQWEEMKADVMLDRDVRFFVESIPDDQLMMVIGGLLPGMNYSVCLTSYTVAGDGPVQCTWARTEDASKYNIVIILCVFSPETLMQNGRISKYLDLILNGKNIVLQLCYHLIHGSNFSFIVFFFFIVTVAKDVAYKLAVQSL